MNICTSSNNVAIMLIDVMISVSMDE